MGYQLNSAESAQAAIQRIAQEQVKHIFAELNDKALSNAARVHQVRKRCKKIRGLIRLVRPNFPSYQNVDSDFREAARLLSLVRDSESVVETLKKLLLVYQTQLKKNPFEHIEQVFMKRRNKMRRGKASVTTKLEDFRQHIENASQEIDKWKLDGKGSEVWAGGMHKTYKRARSAMTQAKQKPTTKHFHEWRKRCKYHYYHLRLLAGAWPDVIDNWADQVHQLSDYLGDEHDLAVLQAAVLEFSDELGDHDTVQLLLGMIGRRRAQLHTDAFHLGQKIFADSANAAIHRYTVYWEAWQKADNSLQQPSPRDAAD